MTSRLAGRRIAVLIDADGVGADHMDAVMSEASKEGTLIVVRAWRHWDEGQRKSWAPAMTRFGIVEGRQGPGKNATDIALAMDAIDLLHERAIDGFCIVTNDRHYEPLAARLRKSGCRAVIMTFSLGVFDASRSVWDHRVFLRPKPRAASETSMPSPDSGDASVRAYRAAIEEMVSDAGWVKVTELGSAEIAPELRRKPLLRWLKMTQDFEVEQRCFNGVGREVDCVRVRDR